MKQDNYVYRIKRVVQGNIFVLAFSVLCWGYTSYPAFFAGLMLGTGLALLGAIYTSWKVHRIGEVAVMFEGKKKRASLGSITRFSIAILAAVIATQYPEIFAIEGTLVGLMIPTLVAYGDAVYLKFKLKLTSRKG
jgi:ATP synthase protein I